MFKRLCVTLVALFVVGCATETEDPSFEATSDSSAALTSRSTGLGFVPIVDGEAVDPATVSDCSGAAAEGARSTPSAATCTGACSFCMDDMWSCWNILKKAKVSGTNSWNESNGTCYCVGQKNGCCS